MPTLVRDRGFEVRLYTLDHPPPHVHVVKAGAVVKIDLATCQATEITGVISDRDVMRAEELVARHAQFLTENGSGFMANGERTRSDRERIQAARARGDARAQDASALIGVSYDRSADALRLTFRGGGAMVIPRRAVPGLEAQPPAAVQAVSLSPSGDALSWRHLDIDIYVPGLVERVFGPRLLAAAAGRRGGRKRTKAKSAAARRNGTKGGRPRKRAPA